MHRNPNKFLSVLFSFVPGAGHMYLGLMKRGISFMAAFFAAIVAMIFFENLSMSSIGLFFVFCIPLIWFISFFDYWRYPRMTEEEKLLVRDDFIMLNKLGIPSAAVSRKVRIVAGIALILAGAARLYQQFVWNFLDDMLRNHPIIQRFMGMLPQLAGAVLIIVVGLALIFWKGRQLKREVRAQEDADEE